ncbi:hypothetical protein BO068_005040 [Escherichia coli]|nr:hypothetical protein [Salmonella enterica subsp. enterica]EBU8132009.1 hypothetical protein [Salmonella enterica subsp. enterica serovar Java]EBV3599674.1 hypothetical protein [Salmonella enterica subsp. enterica serovar Virchow]EBW2353239.1 hypothetical protein [Salmonella enterica subsp. enterica serovar Enteritidis]EBX4816787.1 hypothetical protein [Salmonella enterica subsp. enterica serovar Newport]EFG2885846.1 hypothetical protein [Escherichia coli]
MKNARIHVRNNSTGTLVLISEPSANQYSIEPGARVEISIDHEGEMHGAEIEITDRYVIFFAPSESTVTILADGIELEPSLQT